MAERYNTSKLLEVYGVCALTGEMKTSSHTRQRVVFNMLEPGFGKSELTRHASGMRAVLFSLMKIFLARTTEVGSGTLVAGAAAGEESHGQYKQDCEVLEPSAKVRSSEGKETQDRV
jgi:retinol dehydrogenase 12